jgi:hypothetical protein
VTEIVTFAVFTKFSCLAESVDAPFCETRTVFAAAFADSADAAPSDVNASLALFAPVPPNSTVTIVVIFYLLLKSN